MAEEPTGQRYSDRPLINYLDEIAKIQLEVMEAQKHPTWVGSKNPWEDDNDCGGMA